MFTLIFGRFKFYIIAIGSVLIAILFAYLRGKSDGIIRVEKERLDEYMDTRREMDAAADDIDQSGGGREWLYERQRQRGGDL